MTIVGNIFFFKSGGFIYSSFSLISTKKNGKKGKKFNDYQQFSFFVEKGTIFFSCSLRSQLSKSDYFDEVLCSQV